MNDLMKQILVVVGVFALGLAVGRYSLPAKVVTKEVVKVEIKEVEKKVTNKHNDKTVVIVETKKPDGTVVTEKRIVDKSTTDTKTDTSTDTKSESNKETTKEYAKNQYSIRALVGKDFTNFSAPMVYGAAFDRKFFGPITVGVFGFTNGLGGVSVGLNF